MKDTMLTMLNGMADADFSRSLELQQDWGIYMLDLKDKIFGKSIEQLNLEEAQLASDMINHKKMSVYCFSTALFNDNIEQGEAFFIEKHLNKFDQLLQTAQILKPNVIRLLAAKTSLRPELKDSIKHIKTTQPWLLDLYREAIDRISEAGFQATIENECDQCILSNQHEVNAFFYELGRKEKVFFTYDVQNLWQMGTYPTLEDYRAMAHIIGYFHLKGGIEGKERNLKWKSSLEDASWPVKSITQEYIRDAKNPVICLNTSHGKPAQDYDYKDIVKRDLDYVKRILKEEQNG